MKSKNISTIFFVSVGLLGLVLFIFGLQFTGTLCDEIQMAGMACLGIFGVWAVIHIIDGFSSRKELENL